MPPNGGQHNGAHNRNTCRVNQDKHSAPDFQCHSKSGPTSYRSPRNGSAAESITQNVSASIFDPPRITSASVTDLSTRIRSHPPARSHTSGGLIKE